MPPRTSPVAHSNIFNLSTLVQSLLNSSRPQTLSKCSSCLFSTTGTQQMKQASRRKKNKHADPYRLAQARQRRAANVVRQNLLFQERVAAMGDPVRSKPTPFVESLKPQAKLETIKEAYLNYFVKPEQMQASIQESKELTEPIPPVTRGGVREEARREEEEKLEKAAFAAAHDNALKAMTAITSLENAGGKDRTRVNTQRCIEEFGRHNTDSILPPKPASSQQLQQLQNGDPLSELPARSGPDTGSSEVQVAILTAKINVLVENLYKKDKHNKRNLRLLVHRRQKLLAYLRRKERGGPRWQNLVEKLGINDAMWKGEISLA